MAKCPQCQKIDIKWDWCGDTFYLHKDGKCLGEADKEEIVQYDRTFTIFKCHCRCVFAMEVNDEHADLSLLQHEKFGNVDWELDENCHEKC